MNSIRTFYILRNEKKTKDPKKERRKRIEMCTQKKTDKKI